MLEKVFIAWGGNKPLADEVRKKLACVPTPLFEGIVGGGAPEDMFVAQQVFEQMEKCTHAIVLMERNSKLHEFRGNLMLELGYLIKKYENYSYQISIFFIDVSKDSLPSDIQGIWAEEIAKEGRDCAEIAEEIVNKFMNKIRASPIEINKMEKLIGWPKTLSSLRKYTDTPFCSERELAHYLLHSVEACYYYMNEKELQDFINMISPVTKELQTTINIVRLNILLFEESAGLNSPINIEVYSRFTNGFNVDYDFVNTDLNLHLWLSYFCFNRLALTNMLIARNRDSIDEYRINRYRNNAKDYAIKAERILTDISNEFPKENTYIMMYRGYVYRDLFKIYSDLDDNENKILFARKAKEIRFKYYNNNFPQDSYLYMRFEEEFYLSCCELLLCTEDSNEAMELEDLLAEFLHRSDREYEKDRRHIVSKQIHDFYGDYKNRNL